MSSFMGFLIFALVSVTLAQSAVTKSGTFHEKMKAAKEKCTTGTDSDVESFNAFWKEHKIPESDKGKCFLACILKEMEAIIDGRLNLENLQASVPEKWSDEESQEKAKKINADCVQKAQSDGKEECSLAYELITCFVTESEKAGLKPPRHREN